MSEQQQPFPTEGPDKPEYTGEEDPDQEQQKDRQTQQGEGQVSEVQRLGEGGADTQVSPDDSTAGYPESESGEPDTRGAGPDAVPPENRTDNDMKPVGHRRLGEGIDQG